MIGQLRYGAPGGTQVFSFNMYFYDANSHQPSEYGTGSWIP
jgi:hypothetical protein